MVPPHYASHSYISQLPSCLSLAVGSYLANHVGWQFLKCNIRKVYSLYHIEKQIEAGWGCQRPPLLEFYTLLLWSTQHHNGTYKSSASQNWLVLWSCNCLQAVAHLLWTHQRQLRYWSWRIMGPAYLLNSPQNISNTMLTKPSRQKNHMSLQNTWQTRTWAQSMSSSNPLPDKLGSCTLLRCLQRSRTDWQLHHHNNLR